MTREVIEIKLPIYWACSLINGDDSGLEEQEIQELENYLEELRAEYPDSYVDCVSVSDETWLENFNGLLTEVANYQFIVEPAN